MALETAIAAEMETEIPAQGSRQPDVREHLAHVLRSAAFASSPRLRQFLSFVVERTLEGDEDALKEYVIATTVYGRDITYDPQIDSTVRVEASRLRRKLREFYETEGYDCALEIQLPKGRYVPVFVGRRCEPEIEGEHAAAPEVTAVRRPAAWVALAISAVAGLVLWMVASRAEAASPPAKVASAAVMAKYLHAQRLLRSPVLESGWPGRVPPAVTESIRLFEEVTQADPGFARAWVGLAEAEEWAYELNGNQPAARLDRALAALNRAVQLEPALADGWSRLSSVYFHRFDNRSKAETAARRAVELNPRDVPATARLIDLLRIRGRSEEALHIVTRALLADSGNPRLWVQRALLAYDLGQYEDALGFADHALGLFSGKSHPVGWWVKGLCLERMGRFADAESMYRAGMAAHPAETWNAPSLAYLMARTGRASHAEAILADLVRSTERGRSCWYQTALVLTGLGRHDEAVTWLEKGRAAGDTSLPYIGLEKRFESLREHPRFRALL